ncbi:unnamed protein product [Adineta ricciae]|uniref:PhoD-like phosphatase domain-containing protein n=1 Tax=Adineta ricciae TaxID=249248 RepID=A0A815QFH6_ADIRI|nr:unnamed protein product [Adineta ricciae]CAF1463313.1 unnamed protein product [Adineta ricciae]
MVDKTQRDISTQKNDWNANIPNPVNSNPQFMGDYPLPKITKSKIPDIEPPIENASDSLSTRHPPRPPGPALGPYLQFITTDLTQMLWIGSVLIFRHVSYDRPTIEFTCQAKVDYNWEVLYENLFNLCAYRVNVHIELRAGEGEEKVRWMIDWGDKKSTGAFFIPHLDEKWRGGFFSCNGFDAYVPEEVAADLTFSNVWKHLLSIHEQTHLHVLLWGGDQNYIDFIFEDIPFLRAWLNMDWNAKWTTDFRDDLKEQVEQYHFNTYIENWQRRSEIKQALSSIPSLMMWDDHDIFDGAGSYPPLLHDSPMMMGLFLAAQKIRLLFQHHTTFEKAREHRLFGYEGYNFFARCGRHLAIMGADGRTERDTETVHHENTWQMIFDRLENELDDIEHLIVLFPVPFSFIRVRLAESIFELLKNLPYRCRTAPIVKKTNSIFGLPELYDDLLDEWTHRNHIEERNRVLIRLQKLAEEQKVRITFFSGDVHCCGISRFRTRESQRIRPINDPKLMYQIISSAIVNMPPSKMAIRIAHRFRTKWHPVDQTEEEVLDFFQRKPETGGKIFHKKFRPNRNWCFFEQCSNMISSSVPIVQTKCLHCFPCRDNTTVEPVTFDQQQQIETKDLRIRLWLESDVQNQEERRFASYDLFIPHLQ